MKKVALVLVLFVAGSMIAAAQQATAQESDVYVQTLYIEKVYPTTLGYRIDYRRISSLMLATSYLPLDWFGGPDATAKLVYADDRAVPYINLFFQDGEITHMVLYVNRNVNDLSWGTLPNGASMEAQFNIDTPSFQF